MQKITQSMHIFWYQLNNTGLETNIVKMMQLPSTKMLHQYQSAYFLNFGYNPLNKTQMLAVWVTCKQYLYK